MVDSSTVFLPVAIGKSSVFQLDKQIKEVIGII
jgi:hypothetical protein